MVFERFFKTKEKKKPEKPAEEKPMARIAPASKELFGDVLVSSYITEKATALSGANQYVFKIFPRSNKVMVKKAVEGLYGAEVEGVKIINVPAKQRRLGKTKGWTKGYKKAIVKVGKGQKIEVAAG